MHAALNAHLGCAVVAMCKVHPVSGVAICHYDDIPAHSARAKPLAAKLRSEPKVDSAVVMFNEDEIKRESANAIMRVRRL